MKEQHRSFKPHDPVRRLIVRACSRLKISDRTRSRALDLSSLAHGSGRSPRGIAAGCVYLAGRLCGEPRTQYRVAEAIGITEVTVSENYQLLSRRIGLKPEHAHGHVLGLARLAEEASWD